MIAIENLIRIDRDPNFILKTIRDFPGKIAFSIIGFDALGGSVDTLKTLMISLLIGKNS